MDRKTIEFQGDLCKTNIRESSAFTSAKDSQSHKFPVGTI